jgi:hypothetical protein
MDKFRVDLMEASKTFEASTAETYDLTGNQINSGLLILSPENNKTKMIII